MNKNELKQIILDQRDTLVEPVSTKRDVESTLDRYIGNDLITIITGMRRVGKSTLMQHIRHYHNPADYYIDFDDERLIPFSLPDFQVLLELFVEMYGPQKTFFFDEIQNIDGWERFVRRLHNQGYKVYITGSNATLLSREFGTHLTGRHTNLVLYPFSFREFLRLTAPELLIDNSSTAARAQLKRQFNAYVQQGGLPFQIVHNDADYLSVLYENILYRDIITRYKISREQPIKMLAHYLASNIGKEISFNNLKNMIHVSSHTTVSDYCGYLENSYLCYLVNVHNYSLQKQARHAKKCYFNDVAMAAKIGFRHSEDSGRILENIVYLELRRRHKEIYFHKEERECDFLVKEQHKIVAAYQVTLALDSAKVREREYQGLVAALEACNLSQGYILTEETEGEEEINSNGKKFLVKILPVWRWLLDKTSD